MNQTVFRGLSLIIVVALLACDGSRSVAQPPPPGGAAAAPPAPDAPNPPPAPAAEVVDFFAKVIAAPPVDVDMLATKSEEFPFCRLRLYLGPVVGDKNITGIDYGIFRTSGKVRSIVLSGTSGVFRSRLNRLLGEPEAASSKQGENGVRIVDFWCERAEDKKTYIPLLAKVWANSVAADIPNNDTTTPVPGRICYDDRPKLAECQQAFGYDPQIFKKSMNDLEMPAGTISSIAEALTAHRTNLAEFISKQAADRPATKRTPAALDRQPAEAVLSLASTHALGEESAERVATAPRVLAGGESFLGLTPEAKDGTVTLRMKLPFAIGGGVIRAPSRVTTAKASIDVDVSKDGSEWTRLFLLDPARSRTGSSWESKAVYPLPKSLRGATKLQIRARLATTEETPGLDRAAGPRFLDAVFRLPRTMEIRAEDGLLRAVKRSDRLDSVEKPLLLLVQPEKLDVHAVSDLIQAGQQQDGVDVYVPCDLDRAACSAIAQFAGAVRFWSADEWQQHPPMWLAEMAAGEGRLEFTVLQEPTAELAAALGGGKKAVSFPAAKTLGNDVLAELAKCAGHVSLDGVKELSAEQAAALSGYRGPGLSLATLKTASVADVQDSPLTAALVASSGTLTIAATSPPDPAALAAIATGQKHLVFPALNQLAPPSAQALASTANGVFLDAVATLSRDVADPLLAYAGPLLSLPRLRQVECGTEALFPTERRQGPRLPEAIRQAAVTVVGAEAPAAAAEKELESILAEAVEKGLLSEADKARMAQDYKEESKTNVSSPGRTVERLRELLPLLPPGVRLDLRTGTPLAAFVDAPGVFVLQPSAARGLARPLNDKVVFETLARGRKHLDLSALTSIDATAAAALATTTNILSLDGLTSLTPDVAKALSDYKGAFLSLNGITAMDDSAKLFEPLVREDRASLVNLGMMNVGGLRTFANEKGAALPDKQQRIAKQFYSSSGTKDWTGLTANQRLKGKVAAVLGTEVIFETTTGLTDKVPGAGLSPASVKAIKSLADLGKELAAARTKAMLEDSLGGEAAAGDADAKP